MRNFSNVQTNVKNVAPAIMADPNTVNTDINKMENKQINPAVEGVFRIVIQRHLKEVCNIFLYT